MTVMKNLTVNVDAPRQSVAHQQLRRENLQKAIRRLDVQKNTGWFFRLTPPDEGRDYGHRAQNECRRQQLRHIDGQHDVAEGEVERMLRLDRHHDVAEGC